MIYLLIFIAKILENTLGTLRIILVAHGKKTLGAILLGIATLIWIWSAANVLQDINNSVLKIICFILGSTIGSYLGSILEEKLAIGNNLISVISKKQNMLDILNKRKIKYYIVNIDNVINIDIIVPRKKRHDIVAYIRKYDKNALIIYQKVLISN